MSSMTKEIVHKANESILQIRRFDNDWALVHVTVNRVKLEPDTF
ncbi:hypothetical protein [Mycobacterium leprae]